MVAVDVGTLFAAFGAEVSTDPMEAERRFVEYINKTGGIGGRPIELVVSNIDVAADQNSEAQRACEELTTDNKVDIVLSGGNAVFLSCLQQRGIAVVDSSRWLPDAQQVAQHPNWFSFGGMRVDRYAPAVIDVAAEMGALKRGDKLGVLYEDCPWGSRVYNNVLKPAAGRHGVTTEFATIKCIENLVGDLGPVASQSQAAVLRFRSLNVTNVMVVTAAEGFVVARFTDAAIQQNYRPKYHITTHGFPSNNSDQANAVHFNAEALPDMTGIGFIPPTDVGQKAQPATPEQAAAQAECRKADESMGGATSLEGDDKNNAMWAFYERCSTYFGARALLVANGVRFSIADVARGFQTALGTFVGSFQLGGRWRQTPGQDAIGLIQPLAYDPGDKRFSYTGAIRAVP